MNVVFFGASITQGYWGIEHGWVDMVRKYYSELMFAQDEYHGIYNLGIDGDTTADIKKRIRSELKSRIRPHHKVMPVVVIQAGINDDTLKIIDFGSSAENFSSRLQELIDEIEGLYSKLVLVGYPACDEQKTLPVSWGDYYYSNRKAQAYEEVMRDVAIKNGLEFVPVVDQFKKYLDQGEDLLADGLHPNDAGHELIYQIVMPKLQEILK